jgi:hypothetical protein
MATFIKTFGLDLIRIVCNKSKHIRKGLTIATLRSKSIKLKRFYCYLLRIYWMDKRRVKSGQFPQFVKYILPIVSSEFAEININSNAVSQLLIY